MSDINNPSPPDRPTQTAAQLAQAAEAKEQEARKLREQQKARERKEAEDAAKEADRVNALGEAQADLQRELDGAFAVVTKSLPGFDQLPAKIEAAMARYTESAGRLGDRWPDQQYIRHPAHRLLSWLKFFAAPERS